MVVERVDGFFQPATSIFDDGLTVCMCVVGRKERWRRLEAWETKRLVGGGRVSVFFCSFFFIFSIIYYNIDIFNTYASTPIGRQNVDIKRNPNLCNKFISSNKQQQTSHVDFSSNYALIFLDGGEETK